MAGFKMAATAAYINSYNKHRCVLRLAMINNTCSMELITKITTDSAASGSLLTHLLELKCIEFILYINRYAIILT